MQYYEQAYKFNPSNFETIANLGHIYLETGKYDLAYEYFQKALTLNSGEIDIYLGLAVIAASEKVYDKLPDLFDKIISIDKNINKLQILNFKSQFLDDKIEYLGDIYHHMHNSRKSLLCYHIVSALRNDEKFYREKLIDFYISKDRVNSAIQEIEKVLPYYPDDSHLLLRLGKCYSYLKIPQAARLCYEQILKSNPSDNEAQQMINLL
ncbi:MAG: tetratricopeptide repeat protein [Bacteroidia bacterium]|nr:tetratricopeptide repeat protein [Bacteroidia bacterium]